MEKLLDAFRLSGSDRQLEGKTLDQRSLEQERTWAREAMSYVLNKLSLKCLSKSFGKPGMWVLGFGEKLGLVVLLEGSPTQ